LAALWAGLTGPVAAGTLSRVSWKSHSDTYVNNTIVDGTTSPLGFTATNDLAQPFLNAPDSTVALTYGSYYAISFHSYGAHTGPGTVSFLLDGVTEYSQSVTFPDPTLVSGVFASFALPGGDTVALSATGLAADRIRIVADGPGLAGDGVVDAFYQFNYARAVAPALTLVPAAAGQAAISWTPATPGFGLQESGSLSPAAWTNSASGATNPIVVPATPPQRFFRLVHP
jgi:hypothetical protein